MGQFYDTVPDDPKVVEWLKEQKLFHVASAPLNGKPLYALSSSLSYRLLQEDM